LLRGRSATPAGAHTVEATLERTPLRWTADLLSIAALLLTLAAAAQFPLRRFGFPSAGGMVPRPRRAR
jgi:hypothetical protein